MRRKTIGGLAVIPILLLGLACSSQRSSNSTPRNDNNASYKQPVEQALEQADLKGVDVSEDRDKNTITLSGKLHNEQDKAKAEQVAQGAAGDRNIVNQISVLPVGAESQAKSVQSNRDAAIKKNYKAALTAQGLDKQHIRFDAKNGVLTLKGTVRTAPQKKEAQQLAQNVPDVQQVVNEIDIQR